MAATPMDPTESSESPADTLPLMSPPDPAGGDAVRHVGPYRLLRLLGDGGMGEVWLAEQIEPVKRRVALKIIKPGMETKQVVARFEAERQALALMDHPAIAKVLDGGATSEGRAYFVMEYIAGIPITEFCDAHRLTIEDRLLLLIEVCGGVQHAHQKAIIHRDLKPSNILVTEVDGRAQPKIIDFGVAKAIAHRLTEKTLFTEAGMLIGTPEYMSPEQAAFTVQDIDTRTDVYALGVILYELLTGCLPFPSAELRSVGYDELLRRLREVEPPRPSVQASTHAGCEMAPSKRELADVETLRRRLRGDLDAITMKALEKDRARRYGAASDLAADLEHYLRQEPVVARPPSRTYKLRKYARRYSLLLMGTAAVVGSITVGGVVATISLVQTRRARAEEARQRALAEARLRAAQDYADRLFSEVVPRMEGLPGGATELRSKFISESSAFLGKLGVGLEDDPRLKWLAARLEYSLAFLEGYQIAGTAPTNSPDAIEHAEHVQTLLSSLPEDFPSPLERLLLEFRVEDLLETAHSEEGRGDLALQDADHLRSIAEAMPTEPERHLHLRAAQDRRAAALRDLGRYPEAIAIWNDLLQDLEAEDARRPGQPGTRLGLEVCHHALSGSLARVNDLPGAIGHAQAALRLANELLDGNEVRTVLEAGMTSVDLGGLYLLTGRVAKGEKLIDAGVERLSAVRAKEPGNELGLSSSAASLSDVGHRAFSVAAERSGLTPAVRRRLVQRATRHWKECRALLEQRSRAAPPASRTPGTPDCGGADLETALRMVRAGS
jgi:serine/threonine protein kinase